MKKIGLLINPVAGMGGKVGLKGTDGQNILAQAKARGAVPESANKAQKALERLLRFKDDLKFWVASGEMGQDVVEALGFQYEIIHTVSGESNAKDSRQFLEAFLKRESDLLLFAGGDGTARDVSDTLSMEKVIPVIGIPTGVKIHSPVYALTPEAAGEMAADFLWNRSLTLVEKEVIDIEEAAFRQDQIITQVYGYLYVPNDASHLQNLKSPSLQSDTQAQISAALQVLDDMEPDVFYILGSGSTTHRILEEMGLRGTVLGVDVVKNKQIVARDVSEQEILDLVGDAPAKLVVTPMGGQGYLLGRGNQQLSDKVLEKLSKNDVLIVSTASKLLALKQKPLLVYTGNAAADRKLSGFYKAVTGYGQYKMVKVAPAVK